MRSLSALLARAFLVVALIPLLSLLAVVAHAQDTTVVVADRTGLLGPLIDHYFGAIVGLIQSGGLWFATKSSPGWKRLAEPLKWGVLYLVGYGLTWLSLKTGFGGATIEGNALTLAGVLAAVPTLAAGLIFKIGGHKVPTPTAPSMRPRDI